MGIVNKADFLSFVYDCIVLEAMLEFLSAFCTSAISFVVRGKISYSSLQFANT
jgi:hypothetical protein